MPSLLLTYRAVIDMNINKIVSNDGNTRIVGDAVNNRASVAGWITPPPGSFGPLTCYVDVQCHQTAGKANQPWMDQLITLHWWI